MIDEEELLERINETYVKLQQLEAHRNSLYQGDKNIREISRLHFEAELAYFKKTVELKTCLRIYNENFGNELEELERAVDDSLILVEEGIVHLVAPIFNLKNILIEFERLRKTANGAVKVTR